MGVDPRGAAGEPGFERIDFALPPAGEARRVVRPARGIAGRGCGADLPGQRIDEGAETRRGEFRAAQELPPVHPRLQKLRVLGEQAPPAVGPVIGRAVVPHPYFVILRPRIAAAQGPVKIPDRSGVQAPLAVLGQVGAPRQSVDVHREHIQDVVVDPGRAVDGVEVGAIAPAGRDVRGQGVVKPLDEILDVVPLGRGQIGEFRLADGEGERQAGETAPQLEVELVGVRQIDFEQVPARDFFRPHLGGLELREIHALRFDAERIGQNVDADVVARIEIAPVGVEEHFDELRPRRPAAEPVAQGINEGVVEKRAVVIPRADWSPLCEGGQAVERQGVVAAQRVVEPHRVTLLRKFGRGRAPHIGSDRTHRRRRGGQGGPARRGPRPGVDPAGAHPVGFHQRTRAVGVDHQQRQLAGKRVEPGRPGCRQADVMRRRRTARRNVVGGVDHRAHQRRGRDREGARVDGGGGSGLGHGGAAGRGRRDDISDPLARGRRGQAHPEGVGEGARGAGNPDAFRQKKRGGAAITRAGGRRAEIAADRRLVGGRQLRDAGGEVFTLGRKGRGKFVATVVPSGWTRAR